MAKKDDRTAAEKKAWADGRITPEEAADMGMSVEEANELRADGEWIAGNPLAPREGS